MRLTRWHKQSLRQRILRLQPKQQLQISLDQSGFLRSFKAPMNWLRLILNWRSVFRLVKDLLIPAH